ncbi:GNAT family N-acetyltransferase [Streptomyces mirabilis]|uniref:GNAT family N-acetyltransferase n=1 Tax=Streptomyces mirabilis TaxID=68239 RepID=UPI0036A498C0
MTNQPLEGTVVRLVRLSPDHAEALFPSASDPEVWRWMPRARPETVVQLRESATTATTAPPSGPCRRRSWT